MSKARTLILLILLGLSLGECPLPAFAQPSQLSSVGYLRKLSRRLKNEMPSLQEYADLQRATNKGLENQFFDRKIDEYLKSPEYVDVMTSKLQELFRLKLSNEQYSYLKKQMTDPQFMNIHNYSEMRPYNTTIGDFFRTLVQENRSWDELAVGKDYLVHSKSRGLMGNSGYGFFAGVAPEQIPVSSDGTLNGSLKDQAAAIDTTPSSLSLKFDQNDLRIAGAITTEDFFSRYINSTINKNRQRAAAIFRIFMCEDLIPSIPNGDIKKHAALKLAFPDQYEVALDDIKSGNDETRKEQLHGERSDCYNCHKKLDPAGKHFQNSRVVLSSAASAGALVFDDENGKTQVIPTGGIGEFAKALVQQPAYVNCQVQHFWNWFVGADVNLDEYPSVKSELTNQFNLNQRRVNDFVKHLVLLPEFKFKPSPSESRTITLSQVAPLLSRCNNCHDTEKIPKFTVFPIQNENGNHNYWISKIEDRINRPDGDPDKMPRNYTKWKPEELALIKKWIDQGALADSARSAAK